MSRTPRRARRASGARIGAGSDTVAATTSAGARHQRGASMVEMLIAAPLVLWLGLGAIQIALVMHARSALTYAVTEAARAGSVGHAAADSVRTGLARGLAPYLYGARDVAGHAAAIARARLHVEAGAAAGWLLLRQRSPSPQSFEDWAEPALDAAGRELPDQLEIPNDNLSFRRTTQMPKGGTAGFRGDEPIGAASGQTLLDANLLQLELIYGVPLRVPLVGRLFGWIMAQVDGCEVGADRRLGAVTVSARGADDPPARGWTCPFYRSLDESGRAVARWPVQVVGLVRMQSPSRQGGEAADPGEARAGASAGTGQVDAQLPRLSGGASAPSAAIPASGPHIGGARDAFALGACRAGG